MSNKSEQAKRQGLATELADILHRQKAIVNCNAVLASDVPEEQRDTFEMIAAEDEKNLRCVERLLTEFGQRAVPKDATRRIIDLMTSIIAESTSPVERLGAYGLLKQNQVTCGHLVHKAAQRAQPDVKEALGSFQPVLTAMGRQLAPVNGIVEASGVEMIMGERAVNGVFGRARNAAAVAVGKVLGKTVRPGDPVSILQVLRLDHHKVKTLFKEIAAAGADGRKAHDLFCQLKTDLLAHAEAEEAAVYAAFEHYDDLKDVFGDQHSEHEEMRALVDTIESLPFGGDDSRDRIDELRNLVLHHVEEEEGRVFDLIRDKADAADLVRMSAEFLRQKDAIQRRLGIFGAGDVETTSWSQASAHARQ